MIVDYIRRWGYLICLAGYVLVLIVLHILGGFPKPGPRDVSRLIGTPSLELEGRVVDFPTTRWNQTRFLFEGAAVPENRYRGQVAVTLSFPRQDVGPGDRLCLRGWLAAPRPATRQHPFDERRYWRGFGTFALLKVWSEENCRRVRPASPWAWSSLAWTFQKHFRSYWEERLPPDEAGLLLGVTIGGRGRLSPELKEACIRAGVYHIMVVSGQNVAVIILFGLAGLRLLGVPARHTVWVCSFPLVFYASVVGSDPPVVRAVVTALAGAAVLALRRDVPRLTPFFLAAGWMLLVSPRALFGASFQLSFGATACLLAASPFIERIHWIRPVLVRWFLGTVVLSLAIYLGLWPLLVYYFHRLSFIGLTANWIIFPLAEVLMIAGLGIGGIGMWMPALVPEVLEKGVEVLTGWTLKSIYALAKPSWVVREIPPPPSWFFGMYYGLLFGILFTLYRRKNHAGKNSPLPARRHRL